MLAYLSWPNGGYNVHYQARRFTKKKKSEQLHKCINDNNGISQIWYLANFSIIDPLQNFFSDLLWNKVPLRQESFREVPSISAHEIYFIWTALDVGTIARHAKV